MGAELLWDFCDAMHPKRRYLAFSDEDECYVDQGKLGLENLFPKKVRDLNLDMPANPFQ